MFNKVTPKADSQLSRNDVANLVLADAVDSISKLTGVSQEKALQLLVKQLTPRESENASLINRNHQQPLLEQNEFQFIAELF